MVDHQTFTGADVGDNRVARIGRQHFAKVISTPSAPLIGSVRDFGLPVEWRRPHVVDFSHHHAHCVTKADFSQQIVKRCSFMRSSSR